MDLSPPVRYGSPVAYTCSCKGIRDLEILEEVGRGAVSLQAVVERTGAGRDCGGCVPTIEALLAVAEVGSDAMGTTAG